MGNFDCAISDLQQHATIMKKRHLRDLFLQDPLRGQYFCISSEHLYLDYSRQHITQETLQLLFQLAKKQQLAEKINAMFQGEIINRTEKRAVFHTALRNLSPQSMTVKSLDLSLGNSSYVSKDIMPDVRKVLHQVQMFTKKIHSGELKGATGKPLRNILAIGIGGSYLGPECLAFACRAYAKPGMRIRFLSNVDGADFTTNTADWNAEETLVIIISKTFTTAETMQNARTVKQWLLSNIQPDNKNTFCQDDIIAKHCIAVSTAKGLVKEFGICLENMFEFWDWVGGRFSVTSAVGAVPLSLYLGYDQFYRILEGAHWMDEHFRTAPFEQNIPVVCGLIDIWNINCLGYHIRALLPYAQGLSRLAAYAQQGEMESNGKSSDINGQAVTWDTGEVVFGEPGTNGQHSFYQLLHQGTQIIPADFLAFILPEADPIQNASSVTHHKELLTNFLAQPDALAFGQSNSINYKNFQGNRPSSSILLRKLEPFTAGILIAWIEHRIAVKGFLWNLNSFDQFGVELGKTLGTKLRDRMIQYQQEGRYEQSDLNSSTKKLLAAILEEKLP